MKIIKSINLCLFCLLLGFITGCASTQYVALEETNQVQLRSIQTRSFRTTNKKRKLIAVVGTLQDLGFVISKADHIVGTISAEKLSGYNLKMTVMVRKKGNSQLLVRASAQYNTTMIKDPKPYQDFFVALSKAIFLEAHSVH